MLWNYQISKKMVSKQFFDLLLNFGNNWKVDDLKMNFKSDEVDVYVSYITYKPDCPERLEPCIIYDHRSSSRWRHLDTL